MGRVEGAALGAAVGEDVGVSVEGAALGAAVGEDVGDRDGVALGRVGAAVGVTDGLWVGGSVGTTSMASQTFSAIVSIMSATPSKESLEKI